jgi:hypothetical protein
VQGPTNTLYNVRSYFEGLTDHRAIRVRERLLTEQIHEHLAVPEAVSSASPLPNAKMAASLPVLPLSPEIIPPMSLYSNYIRERHSKFDDKTNRGHLKFVNAFRMLRTFYENFDPIECGTSPKVLLYPCRGVHKEANCLHYSVRYYKLVAADVFCDNCVKDVQKSYRSERHHQQQKSDDTDGKRTAANSRTSFSSLSPGEKDSRMANLARDRKFHRLTSTRLREGLNSSKAKFKHMNCASGFRELITRAFDTLSKLDAEEKSAAKQYLIQQLISFSVGADAAKINEEEAVEFAAYLTTEIDNKGKQLAGKPNQVDFTPALLQSAIVLYLRTKVGYKDQRALSP